MASGLFENSSGRTERVLWYLVIENANIIRFGKWNVVLFIERNIPEPAGVDDILLTKRGRFVVRYTHQENSIPGHFQFHIVVAAVFQMHLPVDR